MQSNWSDWKRFPDGTRGCALEGLRGAGVYEVRHTMTGRIVAFGAASNVAHRLSKLTVNAGFARIFLWILRAHPLRSQVSDLEYRVTGAASRAEAKAAARRLFGLGHNARRLRMQRGLAVRRSS
jgi:hypothetical protein